MADFFSIPLPPSVPPTPAAGKVRPPPDDESPIRFEQALRDRFHPSSASFVLPMLTPRALPTATPSAVPSSYFPASMSISAPPTRSGTATPGMSLASLSLRSPPPAASASFTFPPRTKPPPATAASSSLPPSPAAPLFPPSVLLPLLAQPDKLLIFDLRPPSAFAASHLPPSLSLPIPSTLLRRPAFPLASVAAMLPPEARTTFDAWRNVELVVVIEKDPAGLTDGGRGLVGKFERERGASGVKVGGIKGGWEAVRRQLGEHTTDAAPPAPSSSSFSSNNSNTSTPHAPGLRDLPTAAFQQISTVSTTTASNRALSPPALPMLSLPTPTPHAMPMDHNTMHMQLPAAPPASSSMRASNPFYDNIRQHLELAQGPTSSSFTPLSLPPSALSHPYYAHLPRWLRDGVSSAIADGGESLAMQFYRVELAEQRRLQGVMEHHSRASHVVDSAAQGEVRQGEEGESDEAGRRRSGEFPFSITAGIEKGSLNRYRNIWPFAHTRVRLPRGTASDGSDYVNASFVRPRGTRRRYICAQGPLEATRGDFWNLVWDQDVRIIVMLTKQTEAGLAKCSAYWSSPAEQGAFRVEQLSCEGGEDEPATSAAGGGGFFDSHVVGGGDDERGPIRRVLRVRRRDGQGGARDVVQLQMVSWPDWEVPKSPGALLALMGQVNALVRERPAEEPVLVHCSAGVGRTGSFVLIDAVLDGLRAEFVGQRNGNGNGQGMGMGMGEEMGSPMAVDPPGPEDQPSLSSSVSSAPSFSLPTSAFSSSASISQYNPSSSNRHSPPFHSSSPSTSKAHESFDFTAPRSSHPHSVSRTPTPLSDLEPEPIRAVLEDMREQRMSLCQSLRQYVFCWRAIVEGALGVAEDVWGPADSEHHRAAAVRTGRTLGLGFGFAHPTPSKRHASASPTEGVVPLPLSELGLGIGMTMGGGGGGVGRRPSLKRKMTDKSAPRRLP